MAVQHDEGVTFDFCAYCRSFWFDAAELDRLVVEPSVAGVPSTEERIPERGFSGRNCPRCTTLLETVGWTDLVLDRCKDCLGLFVEAREWTVLREDGAPIEAASFSARFKEIMVQGGWTLFYAQGLAPLILRMLLR